MLAEEAGQCGDSELVIWDGADQEPPRRGKALLWHRSAEQAEMPSIYDVAEMQAEEVRRRYLEWSFKLSEIDVADRPLREHFVTGSFSLWAQSMFAEQSPWKQSSLVPIVKLIALEVLLERQRPSALTLVSADRRLARVFRRLCGTRSIRFEWTRVRRRRSHGSRSRLWYLPHPIRGLLMLGFLAVTRMGIPRQAIKVSSQSQSARRLLIAGPLFNFATRNAEGRIQATSQFWTRLPEVARTDLQVTWLHLFYAHDKVRTPAAAAQMLRELNGASSSPDSHVLLDGFFTWGGLGRLLARAVRTAIQSVTITTMLRRRMSTDPILRFWPILAADWARAFRGASCVENLFLAECFDKAMASLPHQHEGVYLLENQNWERALAGAWRRHRHGRLTGVAHSTIRYWDLRYHRDPQHYDSVGRECYPGPDVVAVNGPAARDAYLSSTKRREAVVDCEALRYMHLADLPSKRRVAQEEDRPLEILVVGDYYKETTEALMQLLEATQARLTRRVIVRVKAHPNCPIEAARFPGARFSLASGPVGELACHSDVVVAGNTTSAAIDAFVTGTCVIIHQGDGLNYSPLRGFQGVTFVRTTEELCRTLSALVAGSAAAERLKDLFYVDTGLSLWRQHLGIQEGDERLSVRSENAGESLQVNRRVS